MAELFFGDFRFDTRKLTFHRGDQPVELRAKTRELLVYLIDHRNRFVSRAELMSQVWSGVRVEDASLTQAVSELRKILGDSPQQTLYIETRTKAGYRFVAPVFHKPTERLELLPPPDTAPPPAPKGKRAWWPAAAILAGLAILAAAGMAWWSGPRERSLQLVRTVREDAGPLTAHLAEQLDRKLPREFHSLKGLTVIGGGAAGDGSSADLLLSLRCRTLHGLQVEVTAVLRRGGAGEEIKEWNWTVPAEEKQIEPLAGQIARTLAERLPAAAR